MGYSGAPGALIYEKNLKANISCQTPLNVHVASAFDVDSAVVDVISAIGVAWNPAFVMFSAAAVVFTAVDIPWVPPVAIESLL